MKRYCTDNGVYTSREFLEEIHTNSQKIRHSGVGGHHQNGVAECAIGNMTRMTRSMMIHAALKWPKCSKKNLWSLAISHADYLHNNIPRGDSGLSPIDIWSKSKSTYSALRNSHP